MRPSAESWIRRRRSRSFPPYELVDRDLVTRTEGQTRKLARLYHVAQEQAWDGRAVLRDLVAQHGGIHVPPSKRDALSRVASVLLWGELAAWTISADLAERLEDPAAKMAATSQVFDEARHFYVLRDYVWQAGLATPRLGGYSRALLVDLLETDSLLHKLVGMQLMVENVALTLFREIAAARVEPVLSDLLYYYERDEARHVGLGALTLPSILPALSELEAGRLWLFQLRIQLLLLGGEITTRDAFETLGIDQGGMQLKGIALQREVYERIARSSAAAGDPSRATRGLFKMSSASEMWLNRFLFAPDDPAGGPLRRRARRAVAALARSGDRLLA